MSRNDEAHAAEAAADAATTADATTGKAPAVLATGSIPAGDADVVAALLDGEFTLAEIDDALDAYEGTGMDRCLTAAMELLSLIHI